MTRTSTRAAALTCILASLALNGCDSDGSGKPFVRFTYTGAISGKFAAVGEPPLVADGVTPGVEAFADCANGGVVIVMGGIPRNRAKADLMLLSLPCSATGSINFGTDCVSACAVADFLSGVDANFGSELDCVLDAGVVDITLNVADRIAGTFEGSASCTAAGSAIVRPLTVTEGSFEARVEKS